MQKLWKKQYDWSQPLNSDDQRAAEICLGKFEGQTVKLPRQATNAFIDERSEIHVFIDASKEACAAVTYLRQLNGQSYETVLLMSRNRLTPIHGITIPRLELVAVLIGTDC